MADPSNAGCNQEGTAVATSSYRPSVTIIGVGWIGVSPGWLYSDTLPPVTGTPNSMQASAIPRVDSANCHITAGSSGEPKFSPSEMPIGVAPEVATLR